MRLFAIILILLPMSVLHGLPYAEHDIGGVSFDLKAISDGRSEKISDTRNREGLSIHVQTVDVLDGRFVLSSGQVTALCLNIVSNTPENWDVDFISLVFKLPQGVRLVDYTREINVSRTLQWWKSIYVLLEAIAATDSHSSFLHSFMDAGASVSVNTSSKRRQKMTARPIKTSWRKVAAPLAFYGFPATIDYTILP